MAQIETIVRDEKTITEEGTLLIEEAQSIVYKNKKEHTIELRLRLMYLFFQNNLPKTVFCFIIATLLIIIGSLNYQSNLVICFCLGMTLLIYSIFTLETDNDLLKQELLHRFKNKSFTTDEEKINED